MNGDEISFLDYEFASFNFIEFEIGNIFCEYMGLDLQVQNYPSHDQQKKFVNSYLEEHNKLRERKIEFSDRLISVINLYALVSDLYWAVWSEVQNSHSNVEFDYLEYGCKRLQFYLDSKDLFFSLFEKIHQNIPLEKNETFKKILVSDYPHKKKN